jgi:hypothetical protein
MRELDQFAHFPAISAGLSTNSARHVPRYSPRTSDHAAYGFKEEIKAWLVETGYELKDYGTFGFERVDLLRFRLWGR